MHRYEVVESGDPDSPWRVHSREYIYELSTADGRTVMSWEWHPDGQIGEAGITRAHLHLRCYTEPVNVSRGHVPTGRVSIEAVTWAKQGVCGVV